MYTVVPHLSDIFGRRQKISAIWNCRIYEARTFSWHHWLGDKRSYREAVNIVDLPSTNIWLFSHLSMTTRSFHTKVWGSVQANWLIEASDLLISPLYVGRYNLINKTKFPGIFGSNSFANSSVIFHQILPKFDILTDLILLHPRSFLVKPLTSTWLWKFTKCDKICTKFDNCQPCLFCLFEASQSESLPVSFQPIRYHLPL